MRKAPTARKGNSGRQSVAVMAKAKKPAKSRPPVKSNGRAVATSARLVETKAPSRRGERKNVERVIHGNRTTPVVETAATASRGKYVYCIIEAGEPLRFGPIGIGTEPS